MLFSQRRLTGLFAGLYSQLRPRADTEDYLLFSAFYNLNATAGLRPTGWELAGLNNQSNKIERSLGW